MKIKRWTPVINMINENNSKTGAEVGVYTGAVSMRILNETAVERHYMIDPYVAYYDNTHEGDVTKFGSKVIDADHMEEVYQDLKFLLEEKYSEDRAVLIREESLYAVDMFEDESLDYVFLDAVHNYDTEKENALAWVRKVKTGGWIGGHNYGDPKYGGVKEAVDELFSGVITKEDYTWFKKINR